MSTAEYTEALRIIEHLDDEERARLLVELTARMQHSTPKRSVLEFEGVGKHNPIPMDAQAFVDQERDSWNG